MKHFKDRVAFVSGAGSGIGLGIARALAKRGARLAIADIQKDPLDTAAVELRALGAEVLTMQLDVADRKAMYVAADQVEAHYGKIHLVFNNAGVGYVGTPLDKVPDEVFDWVIQVNLVGVMNGMKAFVPKLRKHGEGGHITNTSSMAGLTMHRGWHSGVYSATKMGVIALSAGMLDCLEPDGIGVSAFCPAGVGTDIEKNVRALQPAAGKDVPSVVPQELKEGTMSPDEAGEIVLSGIENDDFYILTHPEAWPAVAQFHEGIHEAFMRGRPDKRHSR